jgi:hypothetical protein
MTNRLEDQPSRQIVCARCGTEFTCTPDGECWCKEESARLPMPTDSEDCLCQECLRKAATQASREKRA